MRRSTGRRRGRGRCRSSRPGEPADPNGSDEVYIAELRRLLIHAIDDLPPTFQEIVKLRDVEDRSNVEAARRLHISPQNAAVRLYRAHRLLRERLTPLKRPDPPTT